MAQSHLTFYFHATPAVRKLFEKDVAKVAAAAIRAALRTARSAEVAHQQISYGGQHIAFSSRVSSAGDLVVELDIGDADLANRVILEGEYRAANRDARDRSEAQREAERKLRQRRW